MRTIVGGGEGEVRPFLLTNRVPFVIILLVNQRD